MLLEVEDEGCRRRRCECVEVQLVAEQRYGATGSTFFPLWLGFLPKGELWRDVSTHDVCLQHRRTEKSVGLLLCRDVT